MTGFGLDDSEARAVADRFEQVRSDHVISHVLAALSASHSVQVIFFAAQHSPAPTCRPAD